MDSIMPDEEQPDSFSKANSITNNPGKIAEFYDLEKQNISEGKYGCVRYATSKRTKAGRAVKTITLNHMLNPDRFQQEISIMKRLDHENIVKLYETFSDHKNIYLVMEFCAGGELLERVMEQNGFAEVQAAIVMDQILRAVFYMHSLSLCHRDLKPENLLFANREPVEKNTLKLIDMGLACYFESGAHLQTKAGTPYYVAPEVITGKYNQASDLWSCGVIMHVLLCGYPPFFGSTDGEVLVKVQKGDFGLNTADWMNVSEDGKHLVRALLTKHPDDRYTANQALKHEWIVGHAATATGAALDLGFIENLRGFRAKNDLQKAALQIIAYQMDETQIRSLRDTFRALDQNGDGILTVQEMKEGLEQAGVTELSPNLQHMMEVADSNSSGSIDYTEFLAASLDRRNFVQEEACWAAFRVFDKNNDGKISEQELQHVLNDDSVAEVMGVSSIGKMLQGMDLDGDGCIDFDEFMAMMRGAAEN